MSLFNFIRKRNTVKVKFVHDLDLQKYLKSLGIYEKVLGGKFKCKFCGKTITIENFQILNLEEGAYHLVCSNINCVKQFKNNA